jgi:hypothetical protein
MGVRDDGGCNRGRTADSPGGCVGSSVEQQQRDDFEVCDACVAVMRSSGAQLRDRCRTRLPPYERPTRLHAAGQNFPEMQAGVAVMKAAAAPGMA